jgi:hypothetical protein
MATIGLTLDPLMGEKSSSRGHMAGRTKGTLIPYEFGPGAVCSMLRHERPDNLEIG